MLCQFSAEESIWAAARLLRSSIERYGTPRSLVHRLEECIRAHRHGSRTSCRRTRGTRLWYPSGSADQESRRKGIDSYEAANEYLEKEYVPAHNRRFALPAAQPEDYHGRKPTA
jgi:hypothetical protein